MQPIDTGRRKVQVQCDLYRIIATRPHYKEFKGLAAQEEAELFLKTKGLQERGYIEVVTELPKVITPALSAVVLTDEELTRIAGELLTALRAKKTPDSKELRRKLFTLQRVLNERLK